MAQVGDIIDLKTATLNNNILNGNSFYIEVGTVLIHNVLYDVVLENSNITISNRTIKSMTYLFKGYTFNIYRGMVQFRGEYLDIDNFVLNVVRGRYGAQACTIRNNILTIGNTNNYHNDDLTRVPLVPQLEEIQLQQQPVDDYHNDDLIEVMPVQDDEDWDIIYTTDRTLEELAADSQNVHDSFILNNLNDIIKKIQSKTTVTKTIDTCIEELIMFIIGHKSIFDKTKAIQTLDYIKANNGYIKHFGMTEVQVLQLIWNTIYDNNNLKDILFENIIDMNIQNGDNCHCLTGRVSRMIDIFSGIIDDFSFRGVNYREEMLNKCAAIRAQLEAKGVNDINGLYKTIMKKRLVADYVDSKILSLIDFNKEVDEWIDHI